MQGLSTAGKYFPNNKEAILSIQRLLFLLTALGIFYLVVSLEVDLCSQNIMAPSTYQGMNQPDSGPLFLYHLIVCSFLVWFVSRLAVLFCFLFRLAESRAGVMDDSGLREARLVSQKEYLQMQTFLLLRFILNWVKGV